MTAVDINQQTYDALLDSCKDEASVWADQPNVHDYDFSCPHRFMPSHHLRLQDFGDQVARDMSTALGLIMRTHYKASLRGVNEEYAVRHEESEHRYYAPICIGETLVGYCTIPAETAIIWITSMLGGIVKGEVDATRELSALENDLLLDICQRVTQSFSAASLEFGGPEFRPIREATVVPPEFEDADEQILQYTRFVFERLDAEFDLPFSIIILSHMVQPVAGLAPPPRISAQEARGRLLDSINEVDIPIEVRVDRAEVAVRDIAALEAGDILMLGKRITEPIEVMFCKKVLMTAMPVQYDGRYAVCVQDFREDMPPPLAPISDEASAPDSTAPATKKV